MEEKLQDVPISITVFHQVQLNDRNVTSTTDLAAYMDTGMPVPL